MKNPLAKVLVFAFALAAFLSPLAAQTAPRAEFRVEFSPGSIGSAAVEHFVEVKGGTAAAPVWAEVAKAPGSPVTWSVQNPTPGASVTARVRARLVGNPSVVSEPSNEVVGFVPPFRPGDAKISVTLTVTLSTP